MVTDLAPLAYRREDAARAIGISLDTLDRLVARGEIRVAKVGRAVVIPAAELEAFLTRQMEAANG